MVLCSGWLEPGPDSGFLQTVTGLCDSRLAQTYTVHKCHFTSSGVRQAAPGVCLPGWGYPGFKCGSIRTVSTDTLLSARLGAWSLRPHHSLDFAWAPPGEPRPPGEPSGFVAPRELVQNGCDEVMGGLESVTPDSLLPHASPCGVVGKIKRHLGPEGKRENIIL